MLPLSEEVSVPLLLLEGFVTAFGNVRHWLREWVQMTTLVSMFCFFYRIFLIFHMCTAAGCQQVRSEPDSGDCACIWIYNSTTANPSALCHDARVKSFKYMLLLRVWNLLLSAARLSLCKQHVRSTQLSFSPVTPMSCKRARLGWKSKQQQHRLKKKKAKKW